MISTDYLKARSRNELLLMFILESGGIEGKTSIDELNQTEREDILGHNRANQKNDVIHRLAGLGMEYLWPLKEQEKEHHDFHRFRKFPPYILLFLRRIKKAGATHPLIGKISKIQTAKKNNDVEKQRKKLASITDEDIACFAAELQQDYEEWKQVYLDYYGIQEAKFEAWRMETDQKTEAFQDDSWYDLAEWYHHIYKKEKTDGTAVTKQEESTVSSGKQQSVESVGPSEGPKLLAEELDELLQRNTGKGLDERLNEIKAEEALKGHGKDNGQEEDDCLSDETLARMLELHAELGNMKRMLAEIELLVQQKRELELQRQAIHQNLDEVIERVYGLKTITERQFDVLVSYEIHSLEENESGEKAVTQEQEAAEQEPQYLTLPMLSSEEDQAEMEQQKALLLTNAHKVKYVEFLSERLETICMEQKALLDTAMREMQADEKAAIFGDTEG